MAVRKSQIEILADYIIAEIPGEPSAGCGGAGSCAVRLLKEHRDAFRAIMAEIGVPGPGYPAPVANAYDIAKKALG